MASHPASLPRSRAARPPWERIVAIAAVVCLALWPLGIHRAFGLPAHPLLLHVPVIFVPILTLVALAAAIRPRLLAGRWTLLAGFSVVTMAATLLTVAAGFAFERDRVKGLPAQLARVMDQRIESHQQSGQTVRFTVIVLTAALVAAMLAQHRPDSGIGRLLGSGAGFVALRLVIAVFAVAALFFVIRTGHLGAKLVWNQPAGGLFGPGGRPPGEFQGFPGGGGAPTPGPGG
jgi:hypothetical protein